MRTSAMNQLKLFERPKEKESENQDESLTLPPRPAASGVEKDPAALLEALLPRELGTSLSRVFSAMAIAEEEIETCKARHPRQAERIHDSFPHLCPPEVLSRFGPELYRAHARELLERVTFKTSLGPATKAEMLALLSNLSLQAPPPRNAMILAFELFRSLFPERGESLFGEKWPLQWTPDEFVSVRELESSLRRKLGRIRAMISA